MQLRHLQLGLQVDLVLDVAADVVFRRLAVLAEQHEYGEEDRLQRHRHGQQPKGEGIEARDPPNERDSFRKLQVQYDPYEEEDQVNIQERDAAAELGDPIGGLLYPRA